MKNSEEKAAITAAKTSLVQSGTSQEIIVSMNQEKSEEVLDYNCLDKELENDYKQAVSKTDIKI